MLHLAAVENESGSADRGANVRVATPPANAATPGTIATRVHSPPPDQAEHCPHCGAALGPSWLTLRDALKYLHISNKQRLKLQGQGFLPLPSTTLGTKSLRWRRADLDAAIEAGRRLHGVFTRQPPRVTREPDRADAAIAQVLHNLGHECAEPVLQTPWR